MGIRMSLRDQLSAVRDKIAHYRSILEKLLTYQENLNTESGHLSEDFAIVRAFDLRGSSDWLGVTEGTGRDYQNGIKADFGTYDSEINVLKRQIQSAIERVRSLIADAEREAANLEEAIAAEERAAAERAAEVRRGH